MIFFLFLDENKSWLQAWHSFLEESEAADTCSVRVNLLLANYKMSMPVQVNLLLVKYQGPVVQSVVSLTSSLRVISLTVLADSIHNILIFFAEKMWVAFALQKLLTFFQQKISAYLRITQLKF